MPSSCLPNLGMHQRGFDAGFGSENVVGPTGLELGSFPSAVLMPKYGICEVSVLLMSAWVVQTSLL